MSTIPGVVVSTTVINNTPKGSSTTTGAFVGAADQSLVGVLVPYTFSTYSDAVSALGATTTNGKLIQMISGAFANGASKVVAVVVAVTGAGTDLGYQQALNKLLVEDGIDYVVVEDTGSTVAGYLKTHLQSAVSEGRFRRGYCGLPTGSAVATYVSRAQAMAYDRIFVVGPNYLDVNGVEMAGGVSAAIAGAAAEALSDPALPRTGLIVNNVSGIALKLLVSEYDQLHNAGVLTTKSKNGDIGIMRYLTTYVGSTNIQEGTIALQRDYVQNGLKALLESKFKQAKVVAKTLTSVQSTVLSYLKGLQDSEIVNPDFSIACNVQQDTYDKSKILVDASYFAIYPLNFIQISLKLNI